MIALCVMIVLIDSYRHGIHKCFIKWKKDWNNGLNFLCIKLFYFMQKCYSSWTRNAWILLYCGEAHKRQMPDSFQFLTTWNMLHFQHIQTPPMTSACLCILFACQTVLPWQPAFEMTLFDYVPGEAQWIFTLGWVNIALALCVWQITTRFYRFGWS